MANAKISQLPSASTPLAGTEVLPIVQSGVTDQVSVANLTAGRSVSTGNLNVVGTGDISGNFAINTNKFTVTATSGNTAAAGTLSATGDFAINTNKFNVTASSGNTTVAGTLGVTGNFAINTSIFTVNATTGNTNVTGTLDSTGDFSVNTNKFNVTATSGNTAIAGTLGVTGMTTLTGGLIGGVQSLSGAGAVNLTTVLTAFTSTGASQALTLANGTAGQIKIISHVVDGGSGVLTPTTALGFTTITFTNVGDNVMLVYTAAGWAIVSVRNATVA